MRIKLKVFAGIYLIAFGAFILRCNIINPPRPRGEWDDYTMPIASILNDGNLNVSAADVALYKQIYPDWAERVDIAYHLSGYAARGGDGELTWYFPIYGIACMPMTAFLRVLHLPTAYAFQLTNAILLMLAVCLMFKWLKADEGRKFVLALLLTSNPIVFYIAWPSAEVFIYAMLTLGLTSWYNGWRKRAAVFVSLAGMLNPTIMSVGIVMILEYLLQLTKGKDKYVGWPKFALRELPGLIKYGCCYIIGVIPMLYNLYHTGHINLTASMECYTTYRNETTLERAVAYLLDLNFGILPYFPILLVLCIIMAVFAIAKRQWRYLVWTGTFLFNLLLYSVMIHINSGMAGIARYNAWGVVALIFAVAAVGLDMMGPRARRAYMAALAAGALLTGAIIISYGPNSADNTHYTRFTPIAEWALDHCPRLYNPLHSTFNSRVTHIDGGYTVKTPVIYAKVDDGYVRKILASGEDRACLESNLLSSCDNSAGLRQEIGKLGKLSYISVDSKHKVTNARHYKLGDTLSFSTTSPEGRDYVSNGLNPAEGWGSWSEGKRVIMQMQPNSSSRHLRAHMKARVYNKVQAVSIYVNDHLVYDNPSYIGEGISFVFNNPGSGKPVTIRFELPTAISPSAFGYTDMRTLAIGFIQVRIEEATIPPYQPSSQIDFTLKDNSATNYIVRGVHKAEAWGSWTSGHTAELLMQTSSSSPILHADLTARVYNKVQAVSIYVNDNIVYDNPSYTGNGLHFNFENPGAGKPIAIRFELPTAISPSDFGSNDKRTLALGFTQLQIEEATTPLYRLGARIDFTSQANSATNFIVRGVCPAENWGSWTSGNTVELLIPCESSSAKLHAKLECDVFSGKQRVRIYVNGKLSFSDTVFAGKDVEFDFEPSETMRIRMELPDAISPLALNGTSDARVLALGMKSLIVRSVDHE